MVPRHNLDEWRVPYSANDALRLDGRKKYNCVSIGFPNYRMFYKYRKATDCDWAVLKLRAEILWESNCMFCKCNAASAAVRGYSDFALMQPDAFLGLFEERLEVAARADMEIPDHFTTDPQAEVLVRGIILPSDILEVVIKTERLESQVRESVGDASVEVAVDRTLFDRRRDSQFWSTGWWDDGD